MFTSLITNGWLEKFLIRIFNDPWLMLACTVLLLIMLIGGLSFYVSFSNRISKNITKNSTKQLVSKIISVKNTSTIPQEVEIANELLDEWGMLSKNTAGKRGNIRLKKFNLKAETFLAKHGHIKLEGN